MSFIIIIIKINDKRAHGNGVKNTKESHKFSLLDLQVLHEIK